MAVVALAAKVALALTTAWALVPGENRREVVAEFWAAVTRQGRRAVRIADALMDRLMDQIERWLGLDPAAGVA
jgi:hypothetical protein